LGDISDPTQLPKFPQDPKNGKAALVAVLVAAGAAATQLDTNNNTDALGQRTDMPKDEPDQNQGTGSGTPELKNDTPANLSNKN